eukprot:TRINITY_DN41343_c1_g2_i1.p2 TRINITY_DN41343_c1_g2~~TRINITY_DN41343_c1_g2_i1.p2  ORF type:complete len:137 (+),score=10.57 TRINITY_DN41343_c1_g2_i1:140-550(+)
METLLPLQCQPLYLAEMAIFMTYKGLEYDTLFNSEGRRFLDWCKCPLKNLKSFIKQVLDKFDLLNNKVARGVTEINRILDERNADYFESASFCRPPQIACKIGTKKAMETPELVTNSNESDDTKQVEQEIEDGEII